MDPIDREKERPYFEDLIRKRLTQEANFSFYSEGQAETVRPVDGEERYVCLDEYIQAIPWEILVSLP